MSFRKFKADMIFDGYRFLKDHVLIINIDGTIEDLVNEKEAGSNVELFQGILSPGFINCHCHLELSHMKGRISEGTGLVDFVFKVVTERHFSEEHILTAIKDADEEMISNGIVAVGDICINTLTIPQKIKSRIAYFNFIEASGWLPAVADLRFERAKLIYEEYASRYSLHVSRKTFPQLRFRDDRVPNPNFTCHPEAEPKAQTSNQQPATRISIVPHAPYSVSSELWNKIRPYYENKVVTIHNQETAFEDEFFLEGKGDLVRMYELMKIDNTHHKTTNRSSLQSIFNELLNASNIILVHNTFTKQEDIDFVNTASGYSLHTSRKESQPERNAPSSVINHPSSFYCLCPNANQYIEKTFPPVELFRKNNCNIVLGTDSLASNRSLNILDEIRTIRKKFPDIPLEEMLQWATINGAKALQMDNVLGSFEKSKRPGVNLINESDLEVKKIV